MNDIIASGKKFFPTTLKKFQTYEKLEKDEECDIIVVGGGITGAIFSYYCSLLGKSIIVLEKDRIGQGSSSISTSLLQYELEDLILDMEKYYSEEDIMKAYRFSYEALVEFGDIINNLKLDCDYFKRDSLLYTKDTKDISRIKKEYDIRKKYGYKVELIDENQKIFSFDMVKGIISKNGAGEINPYKFINEMFKYLYSDKFKIYENSKVVKVNSQDYKVEVELENGSLVKGSDLIYTTGYDINNFTNINYGERMTTYNVVTNVIEELTAQDKRWVIKTSEIPYTYVRTTADNRIIIGGLDTKLVPNLLRESVAEKKYNELELRLRDMFPHYKIFGEYKYYGAFVATQNNLPYVGPDIKYSNIYYGLSYGGNGIVSAVGGAKVLSGLIGGKKSDYYQLIKLDR